MAKPAGPRGTDKTTEWAGRWVHVFVVYSGGRAGLYQWWSSSGGHPSFHVAEEDGIEMGEDVYFSLRRFFPTFDVRYPDRLSREPLAQQMRLKKRRGVENRHTTLNHPSPERWWDFNEYLVVFSGAQGPSIGALGGPGERNWTLTGGVRFWCPGPPRNSTRIFKKIASTYWLTKSHHRIISK